MVFHLGGECYALEVSRVREVLDVAALTQVPGGSRSLVGLYNLRGHVVPVWNLRVPFQLPSDEPGPGPERPDGRARRRAAVAGRGPAGGPGLRRPGVRPRGHPAGPDAGPGRRSPFVRGLIRHQDRFLLVLDLDRVFAALLEDPAERGPLTCRLGPTSTSAARALVGRGLPPDRRSCAQPHGGTPSPQRLGLIQARLRSRLQARGFPSFA